MLPCQSRRMHRLTNIHSSILYPIEYNLYATKFYKAKSDCTFFGNKKLLFPWTAVFQYSAMIDRYIMYCTPALFALPMSINNASYFFSLSCSIKIALFIE